jgi:hypothetical protein
LADIPTLSDGGVPDRHGPALNLWMVGLWLQDIEALEQISQDDRARTLFLRMAELRRSGQTSNFLVELAEDPEVDDDVKDSLAEIAQDADLLFAIEEYVHRTRAIH